MSSFIIFEDFETAHRSATALTSNSSTSVNKRKRAALKIKLINEKETDNLSKSLPPSKVKKRFNIKAQNFRSSTVSKVSPKAVMTSSVMAATTKLSSSSFSSSSSASSASSLSSSLKISQANIVRQVLLESSKTMAALANDMKKKPYLTTIAADLTRRVAKDVDTSIRSSFSSSTASSASSSSSLVFGTKSATYEWQVILTFLPISGCSSLATTCTILKDIFQLSATWRALLSDHFKCDLSPKTTCIPKCILTRRSDSHLQPLYKVLLEDVESENNEKKRVSLKNKEASLEQMYRLKDIEHPLARGYRYLKDCIVWGRVRADSYFRRVVCISSTFPHLPKSLNGEMVAHYGEWIGYQKQNSKIYAYGCLSLAVNLCQKVHHDLSSSSLISGTPCSSSLLSLPLVLCARALYKLNIHDSHQRRIGTSVDHHDIVCVDKGEKHVKDVPFKVDLKSVEVDVLQAASHFHQAIKAQRNFRKNKREDEEEKEEEKEKEMNFKFDEVRCMIAEIFLRIKRHADASSLLLIVPKVTMTANLEYHPSKLAMILNCALIHCCNNNFNGGLKVLVNAKEEAIWSDSRYSSLTLQGLFMTIAIGVKQSNYLMQTSNILQSTLASHLGTQAAQASIKELVTLLSSSTISTNIVHSSLSNAGRSGTVVSRKRLGEHQQWRMEMLMKLIFRENGSENKKCKKSKSQYKKRLDIMHKILLKHLPIEALNGWSLWSNANGAFLNASDDWTSSSSDDGNSSETNDEISVSIDRATTYAGSEISSSFSSSSSSYALSLVSSNPSYSFSKYDVNVWGF